MWIRPAPAAALALLIAGCRQTTTPPAEDLLLTAPIAGTPMVHVFYGAYLDHDPAPDGARDHACGGKAYAGHRGVDVLLRNFQVQDTGVVVVAAAGGTVAAAVDGHPDRNTGWDQAGGFGNHVVIAHAGDVRAIYGHLRRGSVRVAVGERVDRGAELGLVGSSGRSNWPHLHFEVRRSGAVVDPFAGPCGPSVSLWNAQLPYQDGFMVTDAGLTDRDLTLAVLLERPPALGAIPLSQPYFRFWIQMANQRAGTMRFELGALHAPAPHTVTHAVGPSFSMRYVGVTVDLAALQPEPGEWEVRAYHDGELIWTEPVTLLPAATAAADARAAALRPDGGGAAVVVLDQAPAAHR
jgi:hypothetical protein